MQQHRGKKCTATELILGRVRQETPKKSTDFFHRKSNTVPIKSVITQYSPLVLNLSGKFQYTLNNAGHSSGSGLLSCTPQNDSERNQAEPTHVDYWRYWIVLFLKLKHVKCLKNPFMYVKINNVQVFASPDERNKLRTPKGLFRSCLGKGQALVRKLHH